MRNLALALVLAAAVGTSALAACGDDDDGGSNNVNATLKDFSIALDPASSTQGDVNFKIKNNGPSQHEFVVVQTDLDAAKLPYDDQSSTVKEESDGVTSIDEREDINPGKSATLKVNLKPGHYVVFCNIPTHYRQGMYVNLTIN
jgi:uncharacterized cupredoxin-like copper-binding protein